MGLFDWKKQADDEILQKLAKNELVDALISTVMDEDSYPWIQKTQSYYDKGDRTVIITTESMEVKWSVTHYVKKQDADGIHTSAEEEVIEDVAIGFPASGYYPIPSYQYEKKEIAASHVCFLLARLIRERLSAKMGAAVHFSEVTELSKESSFTYILPPVRLKYWW